MISLAQININTRVSPLYIFFLFFKIQLERGTGTGVVIPRAINPQSIPG
jgi:hypothetical protein